MFWQFFEQAYELLVCLDETGFMKLTQAEETPNLQDSRQKFQVRKVLSWNTTTVDLVHHLNNKFLI